VRVCTIPTAVLHRTFETFRACGRGRCECQVLWVSSWRSPDAVVDCVHPLHSSRAGGFAVDDKWLTRFWLDLADKDRGVRVQVHTHPGAAFHSKTDDRYPIVHSLGFRSLVIPAFGLREAGFDGAFLCEIDEAGSWRTLPPEKALEVVP
jgi:hypothetical protein